MTLKPDNETLQRVVGLVGFTEPGKLTEGSDVIKRNGPLQVKHVALLKENPCSILPTLTAHDFSLSGTLSRIRRATMPPQPT